MNNKTNSDQEFLKTLWKRANFKESTGVGQCPDNVHKAKNISGAIQTKYSAIILGESDDDYRGQDGGQINPAKSSGLRRWELLRHGGITGFKSSLKRKRDVKWFERIHKMTDHIGYFSSSLKVSGVADGGNSDSESAAQVEEIISGEFSGIFNRN